mmetsp:Transcript_12350/g.17600  ORF Transcript_12350/g.17600 Transcript_12350/m.17600 type:complete len:358 (-) Transcript_12350:74-1147(-)|eukprot:CAMPEP_0184864132 /NCGR_PEP_ID=MMETSP0580-20130426/13896_1 /TAXON_ID=1118495 /ORGANISM="Dactyliosolen fragilissimus" /LENGTH=357 /DNA_ID=CAMNT_0027362787 /DNA_START=153 /DNA_END=1226 /DNA_ORIENTATION=-
MSDSRYSYDVDRLAKFREEKPWIKDPKWFKSVEVSPSAIMKMMTHCHSGVEKGIKKGGKPTEVMGLMLGRPDADNKHCLIVTDVFPLPIEGFETRVIADDQDVVNHMITLGERLERTRREKFMGWYHSHPFDLAPDSHCYLSQTDVSTQLQWQRAEDPHGNPFLAIVMDPLRSIAKNTPMIKAFRVYPPEYAAKTNECPDGSIVNAERKRIEKWGSCWGRYYELSVDYFMSARSRSTMEALTRNFLWMSALGSSSQKIRGESKGDEPNKMKAVAEDLRKLDLIRMGGITTDNADKHGGGYGMLAREGRGDMDAFARQVKDRKDHNCAMCKACQGVVTLALQKIRANSTQVTKKCIFT